MAVLGGVVSAAPPDELASRHVFIALFFACGLCALTLVVMQARKTSRSEAAMAGQLSALATNSTEIARLQASNNELQGRLLELSKLNASLAEQGIATTTGGDSFCWMTINFQFGRPIPTFGHCGRYPLYQVWARIVDLNKMRKNTTSGASLKDDINVHVGDLSVGGASFNENVVISFSDSVAQNFNVFFAARNGWWCELLRLRKVNEHWASALQVSITPSADGSQPGKVAAFEKIDNDYPRNADGSVEWDG
jgi:hypothetical protein